MSMVSTSPRLHRRSALVCQRVHGLTSIMSRVAARPIWVQTNTGRPARFKKSTCRSFCADRATRKTFPDQISRVEERHALHEFAPQEKTSTNQHECLLILMEALGRACLARLNQIFFSCKN